MMVHQYKLVEHQQNEDPDDDNAALDTGGNGD